VNGLGDTPSKDEALKFLKEAINWFVKKNYMKTAEAYTRIYKKIEHNIPTEGLEDFDFLKQSYLKDLESKDGYALESAKVVQLPIIATIYKDPSLYAKVIDETSGLSQGWQKGHTNLEYISSLHRKDGVTDRDRYYLYCFAYLISIEGIFTSWIKMIYRFHCEATDRNTTMEKIYNMSLKDVRNVLVGDNKDFEILFEGYQDGCLRNAIAHNDFEYLGGNDMHFKHIHHGVVKCDKIMRLDDFYINWSKIFRVVESGLEFIWLIRMLSYRHLFNEISDES